MEIRHKNKIISMKEEGGSLHVKKAYDKFVANSDKVHKSECLGILRNANHINRGVIDQYRLLHESLYTIQAKTKNLDVVVSKMQHGSTDKGIIY